MAIVVPSTLLPAGVYDWSDSTRYFWYDVVRHGGRVWWLNARSSTGDEPGIAGVWVILSVLDDSGLPDVIAAGSEGAPDSTLEASWDAKGRLTAVAAVAIQIAISQVTGLQDILNGLAGGFRPYSQTIVADGLSSSFALDFEPLDGVLIACEVSGHGALADASAAGAVLSLTYTPDAGEKIAVVYLRATA